MSAEPLACRSDLHLRAIRAHTSHVERTVIYVMYYRAIVAGAAQIVLLCRSVRPPHGSAPRDSTVQSTDLQDALLVWSGTPWSQLDQGRRKRRTIVAVAVASQLAGFCWAIVT